MTSNTPPDSTPSSHLKRLWEEVLAAKHKIDDEFKGLRALVDARVEHWMGSPALVRPLFAFLRDHQPIFAAHKLAVVSKYVDVLEVLQDQDAFGVADIYAAKMEATTGDFVLGMENGPQYQQEMGWMRQAVAASDLDRIRHRAALSAEQKMAAAANTGRLEVVGALTERIPTELVGDYFGAPGPDGPTTVRWMRTIFREIFLNLGNDPTFHAAAVNSGRELTASLDGLIARAHGALAAGEEVPDNFLTRLVRRQRGGDQALTDATIRRLVGGTIVGTVPTNSKAMVQALEQLLDRPAALTLAQTAARNDDDALLTRILFEALRFNPQNPILLRHCRRTRTLASGTDREKTVEAGALVVVGTESAMFDPDRFREPQVFLTDRPLSDYIHFGVGMHECFGKHIGTLLWPTVLKPLLRQGQLQRAVGRDGQIQFDGAFPQSWTLTFQQS
jgi:cytochrome P450